MQMVDMDGARLPSRLYVVLQTDIWLQILSPFSVARSPLLILTSPPIRRNQPTHEILTVTAPKRLIEPATNHIHTHIPRREHETPAPRVGTCGLHP